MTNKPLLQLFTHIFLSSTKPTGITQLVRFGKFPKAPTNGEIPFAPPRNFRPYNSFYGQKASDGSVNIFRKRNYCVMA